MKTISKMKQGVNIAIVMLLFVTDANAQIGGWDPEAEEKAQNTIDAFKEKNQNLSPSLMKPMAMQYFLPLRKVQWVLVEHTEKALFSKMTSPLVQ